MSSFLRTPLLALFKIPILRNILLVSVAIVLLFPVFEKWMVHPAFDALMMQTVKDEAEELAGYLSSHLLTSEEISARRITSEAFSSHIEPMVHHFHILQLNLLSPDGRVFFSTLGRAVGQVERTESFLNSLKMGHGVVQLLPKAHANRPDFRVDQDILVVYLPVMEQGKLLGAYEFFYDITVKREQLRALLDRYYYFSLIMAVGFIALILFVLFKAVRVFNLQQNMYEQLREEREYAQSIIECSMTSIIGTDEHRNIMEFNKAAELSYGYALEEIRGQSVDVLYGDAKESLRVGEAIRRHGHFSGEVLSRRKSGEVFPVFISAALLQDANGAIVGSVGNSRDLTVEKQTAEVQRAKEAAEMANEAKSRFLANMSHDIRTPMNAVIGMTELLLELEIDAVKRGYLGVTLSSARALLSLINDILDFSKIESGKMVLEQVVFDLRQVLEDTVATLETSAKKKGLDLVLDVDATLPNCFVGDSTRLQQVFMNLVGNAIKFTHVGSVTLQVEAVECFEGRLQMRFAVTDTGIGIPAERLEAIFLSFTQADTSTTRTYGGTGLGVTIAKEIVVCMGGVLRVDSVVGQGSTFYFVISLPIATQSTCRRELPMVGALAARERIFDILLVEDVEENILLAQLRLERMGHKVRVARDGCEALRVWAAGGMDLILMDVHMPCMDGYAATQVIRAKEASGDASGHIPIIAMTASAMKGDKEACLEAGMDHYVSKPIDFSHLVVVMEQTVPVGVGRVVGAKVEGQEEPTLVEDLHLPQEWRGLAGIDAALGLIKWGNAQVYRKTLLGFARQHALDAVILREALARHDILAAKSVSHAMKGAAGTLAATDLEAAAMALDAALRQRKEEEGDMTALLASLAKRNLLLEDLVGNFEQALSVVVFTCQGLESEELPLSVEKEHAQMRRVDEAGIALMRTIARHLAQGNLTGVEEGIADLHARHVLRRTDMERLLEQVDDLDLDQALATLVEIAKYFGVVLEEGA